MRTHRSSLRHHGMAVLIAVTAAVLPFGGVAQDVTPVAGAQTVREKASRVGVIRVIARLSQRAVPEGVALAGAALEAAQRDLGNRMIQRGANYAAPVADLPLIVFEMRREQVEALLASGKLAAIQEDVIDRAFLAQSVPLVSAPQAWNNGARGAGQAIAILDTGVDRTHPFFGGRVVSEVCFSSNSASQGATTVCPNGQTTQVGAGAAAPCAVAGCDHGTHVAGIAAGNGSGLSGVAPDAQLIAVQVFSRFTDQVGGPQNCANSGLASPCVLTFLSDQIRGLRRVQALAGTFNIAAANMSLGGGSFAAACDGDLRKGVIDQLRSLGIATVIASGNAGLTNGVGAPGCISTAVTVGSTTKADVVSGFSNSAALIDLLAPGSNINASVTGGGFGFKSGTSMATPHVAGAFAAIASGAPGATVGAIENALAATGQPITDGRNNLTRPRIDVADALGQFGTTVNIALDDPNNRLSNNETMGMRTTVNQGGSPLSGATVNFSTADTNKLSVSPASATTNSVGVAQATLRGETSNSGSTTVTAQLAGTNASDSRGVLVPDLSLLGFLAMIAGLAGFVVVSSRRRRRV